MITRYQCCEHCDEVGGTSFCDPGHKASCFKDCVAGNRVRVRYV